MKRIPAISGIAAACGMSTQCVVAAESAEIFPSKPVRMIVAQGIGSSVDTLGRIMGTSLPA